MNKKSFSLLEVLIAAIILSLAFGGIIASFTYARAYVTHANRRLIATNLARGVLDSLLPEVRQDQWDLISNRLNPGHTGEEFTVSLDAGEYQGNYTVTDDPVYDYRQVTVTVAYEEL